MREAGMARQNKNIIIMREAEMARRRDRRTIREAEMTRQKIREEQ